MEAQQTSHLETHLGTLWNAMLSIKPKLKPKTKREESHAESNNRWSSQREAEKDRIILRSGCVTSPGNFIFTAANTLALGSVMISHTNDRTANDTTFIR